jgi:hypothetical protein
LAASRVLPSVPLGAEASLNVRRRWHSAAFCRWVFMEFYWLQLQRDDLRCAAFAYAPLLALYEYATGRDWHRLCFLDGSSYVVLLSRASHNGMVEKWPSRYMLSTDL